MKNRELTEKEGGGQETGWEALTGAEVRLDAESFSVEELNRERHRLQKDFYKKMVDKDVKADFDDYVKTLKELHAEDPEVLLPRTENYEEETIETYEMFLTINKKLADAKTQGMSQGERAQAEGFYDNNDHTVEVQSARLYAKRVGALRDKLDAAVVSDEERQKDIDMLGATRKLFETHRDLSDKSKNPQPAGIMEVQEYYRTRATAHNNLIRNLNSINEMCEKYGAARLTYRNFMTNNPFGTQQLDPQLHARQEEDRAIVEQYFAVAFGEHSLDKSFDTFGRGGGRAVTDGGTTNLFDDMYLSPEEAEDKEWVRMRKLEHMEQKRGEAAKKAAESNKKAEGGTEKAA